VFRTLSAGNETAVSVPFIITMPPPTFGSDIWFKFALFPAQGTHSRGYSPIRNTEGIESKDKPGVEVTTMLKEEKVAADVSPGELISYNEVDPALAAKMRLVNEVWSWSGPSIPNSRDKRLSTNWALPSITGSFSF